MASEVRNAASQAVCHTLDPLLAEAGRRLWMVYLPFRSELDLTALVISRLAQGAALALPHTDWAARALVPVRLDSLADVAPGRWGVPDIVPERRVALPPAALDGVLVPGAAFDRHGYRLGYGGGFYDRLLPLLRADCRVVGVAFEAQLVDSLPHEAHDQRVPALVTERGWREVEP